MTNKLAASSSSSVIVPQLPPPPAAAGKLSSSSTCGDVLRFADRGVRMKIHDVALFVTVRVIIFGCCSNVDDVV